MTQQTVPMVYMLHSGNLFGTERMALETLQGFQDYLPIIITPPGPLVEETRKRGIQTFEVRSKKDLIKATFTLLRRHRNMVFMTTSLAHVGVLTALNIVFWRKIAHLHLVHGGALEFLSYGRKKYMNPLPLTQVAVSEYVREKLIQYGVKSAKIQVVGNFLSEATLASIRRRPAFGDGQRLKGVVVSRVIPDKRVHLLFETLEQHQDLLDMSFQVLGTGGQLENLRDRAKVQKLPIEMMGFVPDVHQRLADFDFLVHLNSEEPFGMVLLEAMAAGIPVLVPDHGGTATIVTHGKDGLHFKANDADSLADALRKLRDLSAKEMNALVAGGDGLLKNTYSMNAQVARYRSLIEGHSAK